MEDEVWTPGPIERTETEALGEEIARISSHIDAAVHRLLTCIREFDDCGGWAEQGALSCAHWLTWRIGVGPGAAREYVRVARALAELPKIDAALGRGEVSYCKVRALTRSATPENEEELLRLAFHTTGAQLETVLAKYRQVLRVRGHLPMDEPEFRYVRKRHVRSGMVQITAQLSPEEAEIVMKALEIARERATAEREDVSAETLEEEEEPPSPYERELRGNADRADGLLWLAEAVLGGHVGESSTNAPVEVMVHVDETGLGGKAAAAAEASLDDGHRLEPETTARLLCDASVVRVEEDANGTPLDVGRRTRVIPSALKRALRARDAGCRFPGCDRLWCSPGFRTATRPISLCTRPA